MPVSVRCSFTNQLSTPVMARLVGLFAATLFVMLAAAIVVGHWRERAIYDHLAEQYPAASDPAPIEHRSVTTRHD
jgi:hypothetical protein